jgi:hypothetical protein
MTLEGPCKCMNGNSVKIFQANCSPGDRLQITVKHKPLVVKMKPQEQVRAVIVNGLRAGMNAKDII